MSRAGWLMIASGVALLAIVLAAFVASLAILASYDAARKPDLVSCGIEPHVAASR